VKLEPAKQLDGSKSKHAQEDTLTSAARSDKAEPVNGFGSPRERERERVAAIRKEQTEAYFRLGLGSSSVNQG
jgi:hypothetical protein